MKDSCLPRFAAGWRLAILLLVLGPWPGPGGGQALADDIKLPDPLKSANVAYHGAIYLRHDAVYVTFMHDSGTARVLISSLPKETQALLGYDTQAAAAQLEAEQKDKARPGDSPKISTVIIHGKLIANTDKGLFVSAMHDTGRTRNIQQWSGGASTTGENSETGSNSKTDDTTRIASTDEPIYETVYYLVTGNQNAEYLKPGIPIDYVISPTGTDGYNGMEATTAVFVKSLR